MLFSHAAIIKRVQTVYFCIFIPCLLSCYCVSMTHAPSSTKPSSWALDLPPNSRPFLFQFITFFLSIWLLILALKYAIVFHISKNKCSLDPTPFQLQDQLQQNFSKRWSMFISSHSSFLILSCCPVQLFTSSLKLSLWKSPMTPDLSNYGVKSSFHLICLISNISSHWPLFL